MAIYPFLYVWLIPFLIIFLIVWKDRLVNSWVQSLLPILNLMLMVFAIYQLRIIIGLIQFLRSIASAAPKDFQWQDYIDSHAVRLVASVFVPFLFLLPAFSKSKWFSLVIMLLYLDIAELPIYDCGEWFKNIAIVASWFALIAGGRWYWLQLTQKNNPCTVQSN
ncbi:hypothetical protein [Sediminibacterium sp. TEGAF015]|uniref:hypothetical protein n=1 Tax=Sediminibacterium sp. TEGAF015 TaxID=575378 RepID=UPI00220F16E2|nr:hypothetical protein [Sediminibacterium sp. TEGAF015]BDQ11965.1 hypothetical protein TEGAF0_11820 [Sediminibacterium sp. TEGAF015]